MSDKNNSKKVHPSKPRVISFFFEHLLSVLEGLVERNIVYQLNKTLILRQQIT